MRKIILFFYILFLAVNAKSQSQRFFYEYKFIPDSTDAKNIIVEIDLLKKLD